MLLHNLHLPGKKAKLGRERERKRESKEERVKVKGQKIRTFLDGNPSSLGWFS